MGWQDALRRFRGELRVEGERLVLLEDAAVARSVPRPAEEGAEAVGPCGKCRRELDPCVLSTGGPGLDRALWDELPVAVDAWQCPGCGELLYPRRLTPQRSVEYGARGVAAVQAKRWREAEWWFTRIVWAWPAYVAGHLDLLQALRARRDAGFDASSEAKAQTARRIQRALDDAMENAERHAGRNSARVCAGAFLLGAEEAALQRAPEPALRALRALAKVPGLTEQERARGAELEVYVKQERWLFGDACKVLDPHLLLQGRAATPLDPGLPRQRCAQAVLDLEGLYERHPEHWQSLWMAAMGCAALGEGARALELWRVGLAEHPERPELVREGALAMLRAERNEEAREVNRAATARWPEDGELWCNRAVTELLCGDLDNAEACLARCLQLAPGDRIAAALQKRVLQARQTGRLPRSLAELEGR